MSKRAYIYWRDDLPRNAKGERFANVHLLVGYNQGTISDFQKMAEEMRETFPGATDDLVSAGKVNNSRFVRGFSIIHFDTHIPEGAYYGWIQVQNGRCEYFF